MNIDLILGCVVLVLSLTAISYLVWRSCRTITLIKQRNLGSVRDILQEMNDERKA